MSDRKDAPQIAGGQGRSAGDVYDSAVWLWYVLLAFVGLLSGRLAVEWL